MAGKPIEIQIDAETRGAEQGIDKVADSLDDAAKSADRLGDTGKKAGDQVEDATKDAAKVIDRDLTEALNDAAKAGKRTGDSIGDDVKRGARDADEGVSALKENTAANAKEMGASFQDVNSALDSIQGLAAEALEGFGPAGIAAGVAAAAGLGVVTAVLQQAADKANALTEDAAAFALEMRDTEDVADRVAVLRDRWDEVATKIADARSIWEFWQPRATTQIEQFADAAKSGSLDIKQLYEAFNDPNPVSRLAKLQTALRGVEGDADDLALTIRTSGTGIDLLSRATDGNYRSLIDQQNALLGVKKALQDEIATQTAATAITEALAAAEGKTVKAYTASKDAAEASAEAQRAVSEAYSESLRSTGDAVEVYKGILETKVAADEAQAEATAKATESSKDSWSDYTKGVSISTQELIDEWNRQAAAAAAFEENLRTIGAAGGQALADELRAKGPEAAGAVADVIAKAGPDEQRAAIAAHANATGAAVGRSIAAGVGTQRQVLADAVNGFVAGIPVPSLTVPVKADPAAFNRTMRDLQNGTYQVVINGKPGRIIE